MSLGSGHLPCICSLPDDVIILVGTPALFLKPSCKYLSYFRYILGVESPLICDILPQANEHGLMDMASAKEQNKLNDVEIGSSPDQQDSDEVLQLRKALG